ncbi:MAG: sulfatase [Tepidisphaeraceae bacterium]
MARILSVVLMVLAAQHSLAQATRPNSPRRPNILFALADDWGYGHAGVYGDKVVKTPTFDRVAREGVLFQRAYCTSPSCTPSRGSILTGRPVHQLEEGGNLWSTLPKKFVCYPDLLEAQGYVVGLTRKGWAPGTIEGTGRTRNPAGPPFKDFATFRKTVPAGQPWCFWFGSQDPHRPYVKDTGVASGMNPADVKIPPYLPDTPEVRGDICDYYFAVQRYDRETGEILQILERNGELEDTIVVMTGDNGWPFPRSKANLYDCGTHESLAIRWPGVARPGLVVDEFVTFCDFAPTFLQAAGLAPLGEMTGRSLVPLLRGEQQGGRDRVFVERERHANVREGDLSYPCRAIRTRDFLYLRNLRPDRWPAGDPRMWKAVGPFGDIDDGPSKQFILNHRDESETGRFFKLACGKRPGEELYDLRQDPGELINIAGRPEYAADRARLRAALDQWMKDTSDPRVDETVDPWDKYPYITVPVRRAGNTGN